MAKPEVPVVMKAIEDVETCDVLVVGGGPRGISAAVTAIQNGLRTIVLERSDAAARNWKGDRINGLNPLNNYHKPLAEGVVRFEPYLKDRQGRSERYQRKYPEMYGGPTVSHWRHYVKHLAKSVIGEGMRTGEEPVTVLPINGRFLVIGNNCSYIASNLIVATGMVGCGEEQNFLNDPTGLVNNSPLVRHHPAQMVERKDMGEFIGDSNSVLVVGAGISCPTVLSQLQRDLRPNLERIDILANHDIKPAMTNADYMTEDNFGNPISGIPQRVWHLIEDPRVTFHAHSLVTGASADDGRVVLEYVQNDQSKVITADRAVVAAGYRYDINRIPFLTAVRQEGLIDTGGGRYPKLDENFCAKDVRGNSSNIYFTGEAAVGTAGMEQRWLPSALDTSKKIIKAIWNKVKGLGSKKPQANELTARSA